MIRNIPDWREYDILKTLGKLENPTQEVYQVNGRDLENDNSPRVGDMIIMNGATETNINDVLMEVNLTVIWAQHMRQ